MDAHSYECIYTREQMRESGGRKYESLWTMSDAKIAVPISDVAYKREIFTFSPSSSLDHI